jgi:hypothetical protein
MAKADETPAIMAVDTEQRDVEQAQGSRFSRVKALYAHPWTQIILISLICFCCPGVSTNPGGRKTIPRTD